MPNVLDKSALYLQLHVGMLTGALCVECRFIEHVAVIVRSAR